MIRKHLHDLRRLGYSIPPRRDSPTDLGRGFEKDTLSKTTAGEVNGAELNCAPGRDYAKAALNGRGGLRRNEHRLDTKVMAPLGFRESL